MRNKIGKKIMLEVNVKRKIKKNSSEIKILVQMQGWRA